MTCALEVAEGWNLDTVSGEAAQIGPVKAHLYTAVLPQVLLRRGKPTKRSKAKMGDELWRACYSS